MNSRFSVILRASVVAVAGFALLLVGLKQTRAATQRVQGRGHSVRSTASDGVPAIQATERISIPYGFDAGLPISAGGAAVMVSGQGACTDGEAITIVYTVTQATSGGSVNGLWNGACTGQRQPWRSTATATPSPSFEVGPAQACAYAETHDDDDTVTSTQSWCDDVILVSPRVYLPLVRLE